jgi:hypothetical protein
MLAGLFFVRVKAFAIVTIFIVNVPLVLLDIEVNGIGTGMFQGIIYQLAGCAV